MGQVLELMQAARFVRFNRRCLDLALVLLTLPITLPVLFGLICVLGLRRDGPVFFVSMRCGQFGTQFRFYKFRTLRLSDDAARGVSDGFQPHLTSPFCAWLRRTRLDELPQIFNIFTGDMSWIGPRPPEPRYVALFRQEYADVLRDKPGLTGLATLMMHRYEDQVLNGFDNAGDCEAAYVRRCIPKKLKLDRSYQANKAGGRTFLMDCWILYETFKRISQAVFASNPGYQTVGWFRLGPKLTKTRTKNTLHPEASL